MNTSIIPLEVEKPFTEEEIAVFEQKYLSACQQFSEAVKEKNRIEKQIDEVRTKLEKVMGEYGIKSIDNDFIKATRVAENPGTTTTIIDVDKMKAEEPDLYNDLLKDYPKQKTTGKKKAYVTITAKEG